MYKYGIDSAESVGWAPIHLYVPQNSASLILSTIFDRMTHGN